MVERDGKEKREEGRMEEEDESDGWVPCANGKEDTKCDDDDMVPIL